MADGAMTVILTKANGTIVAIAQAQDIVEVFGETRWFAPSGDDVFTFIDTVIPKIKNRIGAIGLGMQLKYTDRLNNPPTTIPLIDLSLDDLPVFLHGLPSSVYFKFVLLDTGLTKRWNFFGLEAFGEADGHYF